MSIINAVALLYNIAPQAVEMFLTMYAIIFFMLIVDTLLRLFALTFSKKPLWHYRTIVDVFWGGWGQQKSSRVFYRGFLFKLFEYSVLCIFAFLLDAIVIPVNLQIGYFRDVFDIISLICYGYIVLTELFSFKENMKLIKYNDEIINSIPKDVMDRITDVDLNVVKFKLDQKKKVRKK